MGQVSEILIQPDGKPIVNGHLSPWPNILRFLPDGNSIDPSIDSLRGRISGIMDMSIQVDGKIIVAGTQIRRLNSDLILDYTFNTGSGINNDIQSIGIQPDGKILIAGTFNFYNGMIRDRLARLNPDGALDTSFRSATQANDRIRKVIVQGDGRILIGGDFTSYDGIVRERVARLNSNGTIDSSFVPATVGRSPVICMTVQPNGQVLLGGSNYILRLNANGTLDTTFKTGIGPNSSIETIVLQSDGKILIGGQFTQYNGIESNYIARLLPSGNFDFGFNPPSGANGSIYSSFLQTDGSILIGGDFTNYNGKSSIRIARVYANGGIDTTFNTGTGADKKVTGFIRHPNNQMLAFGDFTKFNDKSVNTIVRLSANGSLDTNFQIKFPNAVFGPAFHLLSDNKMLIASDTSVYYWTPIYNSIRGIFRLNSDGSYDSSFSRYDDPWFGGVYGSTRGAFFRVQVDQKIVFVTIEELSGYCLMEQ